MKSRTWLVMMALMAFAVVVLSGCGSSTVEAEETEEVVEVIIPTVEAYGVVKSSQVERLILEIPGQVEAIYVDAGVEITERTPVFKLDISDYMESIENKKESFRLKEEEMKLLSLSTDEVESLQESSERKLLEAKKYELSGLYSQHKELKEGLSGGTAPSIISANLQIQQSKMDMENAKSNYDKQVALKDEGIISAEELKGSLSMYEQAKYQYHQAMASLDTLTASQEDQKEMILKQIKYVTSEIESLESQKETGDIQYSLSALELAMMLDEIEDMEGVLAESGIAEDGIVMFPLEIGIIEQINFEVGDILDSTAPLGQLTLYGTQELEIQSNVSEDFIDDIVVGQKVVITPVFDRNTTYEGEVVSVASMAYDGTGEALVPVTIRINDNDGRLKINYSVDVEYIIDGE